MPRLDRLPEASRKAVLGLPVKVNDTAPFVQPARPLAACRVAIVTTAGLHRRADRPFTPGEQGYRVIPSSTPAADLVQSHTSIGFDRTAILRDINVTFPIDRLRELAGDRVIGGLAPNHYSFMGALRDVAKLEAESGPDVARRLRDDGAEVALLTPTWPLCSHAVGVLARVIEAHGIATTSISLVREHTEMVRPPRALFVPFPFGHALGRPNDPELQHRVLTAVLDLLAAPAGPVLVDLPEDAEPGDETPAPVQASAVPAAAGVPGDVATETKDVLRAHARWLADNDGRTIFGLSGIPVDRFPEVVDALQRFAAGGDGEVSGRPADVPLPAFIRWAADDLKALYWESRLVAQPSGTGADVARWFWGETAAGQVLRRVRDRLDASADPAWKAAAFGVAW